MLGLHLVLVCICHLCGDGGGVGGCDDHGAYVLDGAHMHKLQRKTHITYTAKEHTLTTTTAHHSLHNIPTNPYRSLSTTNCLHMEGSTSMGSSSLGALEVYGHPVAGSMPLDCCATVRIEPCEGEGLSVGLVCLVCFQCFECLVCMVCMVCFECLVCLVCLVCMVCGG